MCYYVLLRVANVLLTCYYCVTNVVLMCSYVLIMCYYVILLCYYSRTLHIHPFVPGFSMLLGACEERPDP